MELCTRLDLPNYCTPQAWHYSRDKADFKTLCRKVGAPVPEDYYISNDFSGAELRNIQYPVVVKPVDLSANRGISYCYTQNELLEAYRYAQSLSKNPKIIVVMEYIFFKWPGSASIALRQIKRISPFAIA